MADVTMPQLGETVTEGTITGWFKHVGDDVAVDELLFEISTDKVDSEVPSPVAGVLREILAPVGDLVEVGQVLARIADGGGGSVGTRLNPAAKETSKLLSPVVRRLIGKHNLDLGMIQGSGAEGRITRADAEQAILAAVPEQVSVAATDLPSPSAPAPAASPAAPAPVSAAPAVPPADGGGRIAPLNRIRTRTAEHMVMSKQTSPHVLTAIEVDYERVEQVRRAVKSGWKAAEGFSLTYLPFIARAVVDALRDYPHLNASFGGDHLVVHDEVNLAIAVDINFEGLLAPVVRTADGKRLRQIARDIVDVAARARTRQLQPDELTGGTFTLTNPGQYGTMMQFPIINQPQVAILSTDGVQRKPVVVSDDYGNESIAIHSVGVLAMAWDHRAFDGAYAAGFLHRVKEILETRDWDAEIR